MRSRTALRLGCPPSLRRCFGVRSAAAFPIGLRRAADFLPRPLHSSKQPKQPFSVVISHPAVHSLTVLRLGLRRAAARLPSPGLVCAAFELAVRPRRCLAPEASYPFFWPRAHACLSVELMSSCATRRCSVIPCSQARLLAWRWETLPRPCASLPLKQNKHSPHHEGKRTVVLACSGACLQLGLLATFPFRHGCDSARLGPWHASRRHAHPCPVLSQRWPCSRRCDHARVCAPRQGRVPGVPHAAVVFGGSRGCVPLL